MDEWGWSAAVDVGGELTDPAVGVVERGTSDAPECAGLFRGIKKVFVDELANW